MYDIERAKELIAQREELDAELAALFTGNPGKTRKPQKCGTCGAEGHSTRTCPNKPGETPAQ